MCLAVQTVVLKFDGGVAQFYVAVLQCKVECLFFQSALFQFVLGMSQFKRLVVQQQLFGLVLGTDNVELQGVLGSLLACLSRVKRVAQ